MHDAAQHYNSNLWKFSTVDILNEGTPIYSPALLASATKQNVRGKQLWKVDFKCSHVSGKVEFKCCHTSETLLTSSLPYIQKGYSKGYHWQNSQPISDPKTLWKWRRSRGGDALWETDMLCWELTILPSHQCCATFRFKEHVWLVVNTSFNQGWHHLGSNWPRRSAAPVGCCPDWIRQIIANAGCGSPLAPWWASCWQICLNDALLILTTTVDTFSTGSTTIIIPPLTVIERQLQEDCLKYGIEVLVGSQVGSEFRASSKPLHHLQLCFTTTTTADNSE